WVSAEEVTPENVHELLGDVNGILVPGGFGDRGIEGKITATRYARENKVPFLGICLGMQIAVIEFARHVAGLEGANSSEINPNTKYPVIDLLPEQKEIEDMGGTMRLGLGPTKVEPGSLAEKAYQSTLVYERHRHRYEVNNEYREQLAKLGMRFVGTSPDGRLVEIVEIPDHPWFLATQFHPEFTSRPNRPQPLFREFVKASLAYKG
ncbi:MAG: glutamine amidotransferase-related protein, partial [Brevibacillus sp.]